MSWFWWLSSHSPGSWRHDQPLPTCAANLQAWSGDAPGDMGPSEAALCLLLVERLCERCRCRGLCLQQGSWKFTTTPVKRPSDSNESGILDVGSQQPSRDLVLCSSQWVILCLRMFLQDFRVPSTALCRVLVKQQPINIWFSNQLLLYLFQDILHSSWFKPKESKKATKTYEYLNTCPFWTIFGPTVPRKSGEKEVGCFRSHCQLSAAPCQSLVASSFTPLPLEEPQVLGTQVPEKPLPVGAPEIGSNGEPTRGKSGRT